MYFSIIINNFNYANYISEAIDSVLYQSYKKFEIIIVDDCSTDNSKKILQKYSHNENIKLIFLDQNAGQANALNIGVEHAKGDAICFLDADDWFHKDKLYILKSYFENGAMYIHHGHTTMQVNKEIVDNLKLFPYDGHSAFLIYYLSQYVGNICSTLSISKDLASKIFPLPFIEDWRIQADDLIVYSSVLNSQATFIDKKLTYYRIHDKNGYYSREINVSDKYQHLKKRNNAKMEICKSLRIADIFFTNTHNLKSELETYSYIDWYLAKLYLRIVWEEMNTPFINKIKTTIFIIKKLKEKNAK